MSKRWASSCRKKRHYSSERRATDVAKDSQIKFGVPMNAYPCEFCPGKWVIGNTFPWNGKEARVNEARNSQDDSLDTR